MMEANHPSTRLQSVTSQSVQCNIDCNKRNKRPRLTKSQHKNQQHQQQYHQYNQRTVHWARLIVLVFISTPILFQSNSNSNSNNNLFVAAAITGSPNAISSTTATSTLNNSSNNNKNTTMPPLIDTNTNTTTDNTHNMQDSLAFLDDLRQKYKHQPTFLQAVEEMALSLLPVFRDPENGDYYQRVFLMMAEPERIIAFR
jgi:hypothetical protein